MSTKESQQQVYHSGDVVCLTCGVVVRNDPRINGVSHGYCTPCGKAELARLGEWIAQREAKMAAEAQGKGSKGAGE